MVRRLRERLRPRRLVQRGRRVAAARAARLAGAAAAPAAATKTTHG